MKCRRCRAIHTEKVLCDYCFKFVKDELQKLFAQIEDKVLTVGDLIDAERNEND